MDNMVIAIPMASYLNISATLEEAGLDQTCLTMIEGQTVFAIELGSCLLIPIGDGTDWIVNKDLLTAAIEDACNEAFRAGWEANERAHKGPSAAGYPEDVDAASDLFELSDATKALIENGGVVITTTTGTVR
jgi:hypothetical protein